MLGEFHIVTTGFSIKLAAILLVQGHFHEALSLYLSCYQTLSNLSDNFLDDTKQCLCGVTICYWKIYSFAEAQKYCSLLIQICKACAEEGPSELRYLVLMTDILIASNKKLEGVSFLEQAFSIVKKNSDKFNSPSLMNQLSSKAFVTLRTTLSMQNDHLLTSFRDEFKDKIDGISTGFLPFTYDPFSNVLRFFLSTL